MLDIDSVADRTPLHTSQYEIMPCSQTLSSSHTLCVADASITNTLALPLASTHISSIACPPKSDTERQRRSRGHHRLDKSAGSASAYTIPELCKTLCGTWLRFAGNTT